MAEYEEYENKYIYTRNRRVGNCITQRTIQATYIYIGLKNIYFDLIFPLNTFTLLFQTEVLVALHSTSG
jgi:hypothetical protein